MEVKQATANPVTSLSAADLVMAHSGGAYHPITVANLMKAVRESIQIGGRNLLLQSNTPKTNGQSYSYSEKPEIGKTYALTACMTIGQGVTLILLCFNGENFVDGVRILNPVPGEKVIVRGVQTITKYSPYLYVYTEGGNVTCHWAVIVEGNMPVTGWFPAPEDLRGG